MTNAKSIAAQIRGKNVKFRKGIQRGLREGIMEGWRHAMSLAPMKSGMLKGGIHWNVKGFRATLSSEVAKSFPYNMWVNQDIKMITSGKPWFATKAPKVYGGNAHAPSGRPINWTGTPGYMNIVFQKLHFTLPKKIQMKVTQAINR